MNSCFAGKEIDPGQFFHRAFETPHQRLPAACADAAQRGLGGADALDQGAVFRAAVEKLAHVGELRGGPRFQLSRHGEAAVRTDIGLHLGEGRRVRRGGQDIDAVAQRAASGLLELAPEAHAQRRIARRQAQH